MRFGLIMRGQYPQGDDMRVRLKEDLDAAKFAQDLGFDIIGKGSHYSSHPFQYIQQIPYLCQVAMIAPKFWSRTLVSVFADQKGMPLGEGWSLSARS